VKQTDRPRRLPEAVRSASSGPLLRDRRASSKLPGLVELVLSRPLVSIGMIQQTLKVSKQGALNLIGELSLREMTGRGRFRRGGSSSITATSSASEVSVGSAYSIEWKPHSLAFLPLEAT
jgi:hypothetical protein